jgi:hypothetical protein
MSLIYERGKFSGRRKSRGLLMIKDFRPCSPYNDVSAAIIFPSLFRRVHDAFVPEFDLL